MKKAILTFGLFSMMLVLTSFTSPEIGGGNRPPGNGAPLAGIENTKSDTSLEIGGGQKPPEMPAPFTMSAGQYLPQAIYKL